MVKYSKVQGVVHGKKLPNSRYQARSHAIRRRCQVLISVVKLILPEVGTLIRSAKVVLTIVSMPEFRMSTEKYF